MSLELTEVCDGIYTVSQKVPTFKLSVNLSDLNWFSNFFHCCKAHEICYETHTWKLFWDTVCRAYTRWRNKTRSSATVSHKASVATSLRCAGILTGDVKCSAESDYKKSWKSPSAFGEFSAPIFTRSGQWWNGLFATLYRAVLTEQNLTTFRSIRCDRL